ncbi:hypothetical protein COCSUDRAFT_53579 [Coccomyxa subellipsoidea C-169]|uniref:NYN domain-containing protein n=1 Tax=Coccomyxa subellipsoidea (strain C-169) TaxID=574566 RepID=I0YVY3_COCSC|nr:hypothetical protein COCSUDRAFT_53579 [Coccomyxa subellipsoidea C-169]EIE22552.1 hypothetical protein COCSUDRAFT_53579 [Coccomyxa subellipsoidea C-169]|eukprot:XP_005647096.1 hypothetical protein COCSUDRAFT_53579 [Coccomyxa subellipsoidea C-169]
MLSNLGFSQCFQWHLAWLMGVLVTSFSNPACSFDTKTTNSKLLERSRWPLKPPCLQAFVRQRAWLSPCRKDLCMIRAQTYLFSRNAGIKAARCIVFWDLDNIMPKKIRMEHTCEALKAATASAVGTVEIHQLTAADVFILAYATECTLKMINFPALKRVPNVKVVPVASHRQAADQVIIRHMTALVNERSPDVALAIVSCDNDFASVLSYCRGRGCPTVCIGRARRRHGPAEISERELMQWRKRPLPAAAAVAVCWEHIASPDLCTTERKKQAAETTGCSASKQLASG